jgi:hypothetical protein
VLHELGDAIGGRDRFVHLGPFAELSGVVFMPIDSDDKDPLTG